MLDHCAPGYKSHQSKHKISIEWNKICYPSLPTGEKRRGENADIGTSQVRQLVRILMIDPECAGRWLPSLAGSFK